jgi:hypothetical protein
MPQMTFVKHHLQLIAMAAGRSPFNLALYQSHVATKNYCLTTIDGDEEV